MGLKGAVKGARILQGLRRSGVRGVAPRRCWQADFEAAKRNSSGSNGTEALMVMCGVLLGVLRVVYIGSTLRDRSVRCGVQMAEL